MKIMTNKEKNKENDKKRKPRKKTNKQREIEKRHATNDVLIVITYIDTKV